MLHIILLILKIIGITLLVIIGLILLLILLLLFVPVRYRGEGSVGRDDPVEGEEKAGYIAAANAKVTWLLHIISCSFNYSDGIGYIVRVFGIGIIREGNMAKPEKEKKRKKGRKEEDPAEADKAENAGEEADKEEAGEDKAQEDTGKKEKDGAEDGAVEKTGTEAGKEEKAQTKEDKSGKTTAETDKKEAGSTETGKEEETGSGKTEESGTEAGNEEKAETETGKKGKKNKKGQKDKKDKKDGSGKDKKKKRKKDKDTGNGQDKEKQSLVEKVKTIYNEVVSIKEDKKVARAYELCKCMLVKLINAVRPRKLSGHASYGFEDPAITGYITAFLASQYSRVRDLDIDPHFEDEILEGDLKMKGRIYLITMLRIGLKLYFNKDLKYTVNRLKNFGKGE